jgi:hypothetical protein
VKRFPLVSFTLVAVLALGAWFAWRGPGRGAAERTFERGANHEAPVEEAVRLADPGRVLDVEAPSVAPAARAERVGSSRSTRTSAAPTPGPASVVGRLVLPDGETLPEGKDLGDVQLDWRAPSSRRVEPLEGGPGAIAKWDGHRCIMFADADGAFEYTNAYVGVAVELELTGHGPAQVVALPPLEPGEHRRLDVVLDLGVTVSGWVRDEKGRALPGVRVFLEDPSVPAAKEEHATLPQAEADELGCFELARVARRSWSAFVWGYGLASGVRPVIDASSGPVHGVELVVWRGGVIEGTVSWSDGTPVEAFWIDFHGRKGRRERSSGGRFRVEQLAGSEYLLELRASDGSSVVLPRVPTDGGRMPFIAKYSLRQQKNK